MRMTNHMLRVGSPGSGITETRNLRQRVRKVKVVTLGWPLVLC